MSLHIEVLSEAQKAIIPMLATFATEQKFYLAGGTAVALHLGHRRSIDFDWFAHGNFEDPISLAEKARLAGLPVEDVQVSRGTLHTVIGGVKVSFFEYLYHPISSFTTWPDDTFTLASLDDLACMKLVAIAQRGSRKDFIDLYTIALEHKPVSEFLELYRQKYSVGDIGHVLVGMTYFDDAQDEPSPIMLREFSWDDIKRYFQQWAKTLSD